MELTMQKINDDNHAKMVTAYIVAMQWASTDFDGNSLEDYELSEDAHQAASVACARFMERHTSTMDLIMAIHSDYGYEQAGHDLFLNRERHGAGFWDRGLGHYGDVLSKYCDEIGACDPCVGDDNLIYMGE
jgi:hypothetical protein